MTGRLPAWLRFFRIVNLPTVPGDVLAGAAAFLSATGGGDLPVIAAAAAASCFVYLFGLADNDIIGAKTDVGRPIPSGEISLGAARVARALCGCAALGCGAVARLPPAWWCCAGVLLLAVVVYNRTKNAWLMGVCRGLDVALGAFAASGPSLAAHGLRAWSLPAALALVWSLYIGWVTKYSEGEESDPARKETVGFLIGALIYLQLGALVFIALSYPRLPVMRPLLMTGAVLLLLLRLMRRLLPKVSAS